MNIEQLANIQKINETDENKAKEIALSIIENGWNDNPILVMNDGETLITGSHRVEAAKILVEMDVDSDHELEYSLIEVDYLDVTEYVNDYCENTGNDIEYDCLRKIFEETDIEETVKQNIEW